MPIIEEQAIAEVMEGGNGASIVLPDSGAGFVKLSYLWGKLRVDKCDEVGNIIAPERRGGGGDIALPSVP